MANIAPKLGKKISNFTFLATDESISKLSDLGTKFTILFFYPKDNTPGCTKESIGFSEQSDEFAELDTRVLGISRDNIKSHLNFIEKQKLSIDLISDKEEVLCNLFDVIKEKNMYGKKVMGIERSTFILDANHKLVAEWRKVKVPGHVEEVLEKVKELSEVS